LKIPMAEGQAKSCGAAAIRISAHLLNPHISIPFFTIISSAKLLAVPSKGYFSCSFFSKQTTNS
ncbi:MAG: hypothetical protein KDC44_18125, partial [Phaeodactylibacter sp.]|nr:hypothetical protein [Phaeodactylibacter sp.]